MINLYAKDIAGRLFEIEYKSFVFSGGEPHIEIDVDKVRYKRLVISYASKRTDDIVILLALVHALKAAKVAGIDLFIPYFPGARQDRQENGWLFTVQMYADIINSCGFRYVHVLDPHSYVTPALIRNCIVHNITSLIDPVIKIHNINGLISPDAGALKRTMDVAKYSKIDHVICASKNRDPITGALSGFTLPEIKENTNYLVVDDICDGGGTFLGLAKEFYEQSITTSSISLWVTHGIFSKGITELEERYKYIYTTDSLPQLYATNNKFRILNLSLESMVSI